MTKNKIAVVTGSNKWIGKATALAFAKSNEYSGIVVNARRMHEALRTVILTITHYSRSKMQIDYSLT